MSIRTAVGSATILDLIDGNKVEYRYLTAPKSPSPNKINNRDPSVVGYSWTTIIPVATGTDIVWVIVATINPNNQLVGVWSNPAQFSGRSTITGTLSNSAAVVQTNANGLAGNFANIGGTFQIYDGTTLIDPLNVVFSSINEVGIDLNINSSGVYSIGALGMSADNGTCTLQAVYQGLTIQQIYNISKAKQGIDGIPAVKWYLKPINGTAIKNTSGNLTVEARKITGSTDTLATGNYKIYVGGTVLPGSEYTRTFAAAQINGSVLVELKNGSTLIDTITLIDVTDGGNATIGSVTANNGLSFSKNTNGVWSPTSTITVLTATFYRNSALVYTNSVTITRSGSTLTSNVAGVAQAYSNGESTSSLTVTFTDPVSGLTVNETVFLVQDGVKGDTGLPAKLVSISSDYQAFAYDKDGILKSASTIAFTSSSQNLTQAITWSTLPNVASGTGTTFNLTTAQFGVNSSVKVIATANGVSDSITIVRLDDGISGVDSLTALLTNEAHTIPTNNTGGNGNYVGSGTDIYLYEGTSQLTYNALGTTNGTWKVTAVAIGITVGAVSDSGTFATVANQSLMTADVASITYTIIGKRLDGTAILLTKIQSFSKSKVGADGTPAAEKYTWVVYSNSTTTGTISLSQLISPVPTPPLSPKYKYTGISYGNLAAVNLNNGSHLNYDWALTVDLINLSDSTMFLNKLKASEIDVLNLFAGNITATGTITGATLQTATSGVRTIMKASGAPFQILNGNVPVFSADGLGNLNFAGDLGAGTIKSKSMFTTEVWDLLVGSVSSSGTSTSTGGSISSTINTLLPITTAITTKTLTLTNIDLAGSVTIDISISDSGFDLVTQNGINPTYLIKIFRGNNTTTQIYAVTKTGIHDTEAGTTYLSANISFTDNTPAASANAVYTATVQRLSGAKDTPIWNSFSVTQAVSIIGSSTYSLPTATASQLGGIKVGTGLTVTSGVLSADAQTTTSNKVLAINGSTLAPSISFVGDPDTGLFWNSTGQMGFSANGSTKFRIDSGSHGLLMDSAIHMNNNQVNYVQQLHFNVGCKFIGGNSSYIYYRSASNTQGGILVQNGSGTTKGYLGYWDSAGFGLLNSAGNWWIRTAVVSSGAPTVTEIFGSSLKVGGNLVYHVGNKPSAADVGALGSSATAVDSSKLGGLSANYFRGLNYGSSTQDPNLPPTQTILSNHANTPVGGLYWYITTTFYSTISTTSSRGQIATSYSESISRMYVRRYYAGTWTAWVRCDNNGISLSGLGYTGATNANYITNNNQLTNGAGYQTINSQYTAGAALSLVGGQFSVNLGTGSTQAAYGNHTHAYDNYSNWLLQINSSGSTSVASGNTVNFIAGTNVSLSKTSNAITINSSYINSTYTVSGALFMNASNNITVVFGAGYSQAARGNHTHDTRYIRPDVTSTKWTAAQWASDLYPNVASGSSGKLLGNLNYRWSAIYCVSGYFTGNVSAADHIATSDSRVKENQKVIENASNTRSKLTGKTFNRTDMDGRKHAGIIAQDLEGVFEEALFSVEDEKLGNKLCVSNTAIIGLLVQSANEDRKIIDKQQKQIDKLTKLVKGLIHASR